MAVLTQEIQGKVESALIDAGIVSNVQEEVLEKGSGRQTIVFSSFI